MTVFEFWPDYGPGPLWTDEGKPADLAALSLGDDLSGRLIAWNAGYSEDKVPLEGSGDKEWLSEGRVYSVRSALP